MKQSQIHDDCALCRPRQSSLQLCQSGSPMPPVGFSSSIWIILLSFPQLSHPPEEDHENRFRIFSVLAPSSVSSERGIDFHTHRLFSQDCALMHSICVAKIFQLPNVRRPHRRAKEARAGPSVRIGCLRRLNWTSGQTEVFILLRCRSGLTCQNLQLLGIGQWNDWPRAWLTTIYNDLGTNWDLQLRCLACALGHSCGTQCLRPHCQCVWSSFPRCAQPASASSFRGMASKI